MGVIKDTHGQLENPPVVYTLFMLQYPEQAQLLLSDITNIVAALQAQLKRNYPILEQHEQQGLEVAFGPEGHKITTIERKELHFISADRLHALVIKPDRLLVHTAGYSDFREFALRIREGVGAICNVLQIEQYAAIGIRAIDAFSFSDDPKALSTAFYEKLLPFRMENLGLEPQLSTTLNSYKTEFGNLTVRTYYSQDSMLSVPQDLQPLAFQLAISPKEIVGPSILLDFDHVFIAPDSTVIIVDIDSLMVKVEKMHDDASQAFLSSVRKEYLQKVLKPGKKL